MPAQNQPYQGAADALGLGGEGDALDAQMTDEEKARRKKLNQLAGQQDTLGARGMGLAATQLLGQFRA